MAAKLVRGINELVNNRVPVTGGLAGDGTNFQSTVVGLNEQPIGRQYCSHSVLW